MDSCLDLEPAAPSSDAHAGGEPTAPAAPHDSPSPEAAAQQDEAVKHEEAECALEPAGAMMLASDDGGLVGASGQRISAAEIQLVQNLVERCLQCYMNMREVVAILQQQAKIEPDFTALVWQKLEEQNAEFFNAYYTRLRLKDQILAFNNLLEQHAMLGQKLGVRSGGAGGGRGRGLGAPPNGGKVSTSGLFLDRSGAFHSAGDYLIDTGGGGGGGHAMPMPGLGAGMGHHEGGAGAGGGLGHLPRSFSLSDLSVELTAQMAEGDVHMALMGSLNFAGDGGLGGMCGMGAGGGAGGGEGMHGKLPHSFSLSDMTLFNEPRMQA